MKNALYFVGGLATGAIAAWMLTKKYYADIAQEEIDEQRRWFKTKCENCPGNPKLKDAAKSESPKPKEDPIVEERKLREQSRDLANAVGIIEREGYTQYGKATRERIMNGAPSKYPYVISPEEYGEYDDYTQVELHYYADGVLTDDMDVPVESPNEFLCEDWASRFGEYRDDVLHIRNDVRRCDYEILKNLMTFKELIQEQPYKAEV